MSSSQPNSSRVLLAFASVYLMWGSTYLAIKVAGEHLPVLVVSSSRSLLTTALIVVISLVRGKSLRVEPGEWWRLCIVGLLFMSANNNLLTWGETMVPSGFAALVVCTLPIWVALLDMVVPGAKEPMNARGWLGTMLGVAGISVLVWPSLHGARMAGYSKPGLGVVVLLGCSISFAIGSILSRRWKFKTDTFVATGYQIGAAGLFNVACALGSGRFRYAHWSLHGVEAIAYLSVFGSLVGLVAFTYLLQNVAVSKVATYAFVNPMIAVLLGAVVLGERMTPVQFAGMAVIVASVAMVVFSRSGEGKREIVGDAGEAVE